MLRQIRIAQQFQRYSRSDIHSLARGSKPKATNFGLGRNDVAGWTRQNTRMKVRNKSQQMEMSKTTATPTASSSSANSNNKVIDHIMDNASPLMNNKTMATFGMSASEICGHMSFVCATAAYANTDILVLRGLAMGGISLSMLFQFYRPAPLWIPIRWNVLLLAINAVMILHLLAERDEANRMPQEWAQIYSDAQFEARGFSKVEFNKLMQAGTLAELKEGTRIAVKGKENRLLYLLIDGEVSIQSDGKHIATLYPYQFIGEMAFLAYSMDDKHCDDHDESKSPGNRNNNRRISSDDADISTDDTCKTCTPATASADAIVQKDHTRLWAWEFPRLKETLDDEREVSNALSAYINHDLRHKLMNTANKG